MTDREKRREPFVGWMSEDALNGVGSGRSFRVYQVEQIGVDSIPVVITPLLPDDPRPGETWLNDGEEVVILPGFVPQLWGSGPYVCIGTDSGVGIMVAAASLRRPPKLKTWILKSTIVGWEEAAYGFKTKPKFYTFKAESRDDALAKLRDALTEVE